MAKPRRNEPAKRKARVSLPVFAPPPGSPFAGISGTNAPAKNERIPNLTEQVALARARKQRLTHGGLLTPTQQKAEAKAAAVVTKPTRNLNSVLANSTPRNNAPIRIGAPPVAPTAAPPRTPAAQTLPIPPGRRGAPLTGSLGFFKGQGPKSPEPGWATKTLKGAGNAVLKDPLGYAMLLTAGGSAPTGQLDALRHGNVTQQTAKIGLKAASGIQRAGTKVGSINVNLLSPAQAASFPGQKTVTEDQIKELEAEKGGLGGLPAKTRHTLVEGAVANGWPRQDIIKMVDSDLIHAYGNKPANPVIQFIKNAGSFAATQAAAPAGFAAIADASIQAAKGDTTPLKKIGQQFVEGTVNTLPIIGDRPFTQNLYWHPGETAQNFLLFEGAADRLLSRAGKFATDTPRLVTPEGFTTPISRGNLSPRPINRSIQLARDKAVRSENMLTNKLPLVGGKARRTAIAKGAYEATRERAVAPVMAKGAQLRADVMRTANKVGKERAAALNAHLQGADAARAAFYRQVSQELGPVRGRGAAAHAKLSEQHPITEATMTAKDRAYVDAVRAAATFSTETRAGVGQLSADLSGRYRAYQAPIVMAAKTGDELAQRAQALHNQWTNALAKKLPPEELAPIADEFSKTLDEVVQRHAGQGGTTPVYIPQEVPQTLVSKFKREASITATGKVPKMPATQDKLISSGQYRSTPAGVSLEAHRAAVIRARVDHFKAVSEEYATKAENGGPADPNVTYVKADNLRSPVKLQNTVGEHNLTDEQVHSTLDQMRQALETGKVDVTSGYIPATGDIRAIPTTVYEELHSSTLLPKGAPIGQVYDKANRAYQRFMLSKPSTGVANVVGNPILAALGGASPLDIYKGYGLIKNHPEWIPPALIGGKGLAGTAGTKIASTPIGKYINFSLSHQRASEDAARAALYHHLVGPHVRRQMETTGQSADEVLRALADGRDPQSTVFVKKVEDFLGTMKPSKKVSKQTEQMFSRSILFHRWLGHILTLTLYTMPVKYPGRAVILQRISEIGDDYRKHHGIYPSWYLSMIPLMQHIANDAGVSESFARALPTGTIWPTANMPLPLADSGGASPWGAAIGATQPVVRAALEAPTGMDWATLRPYTDAKGNPIGPGLNLPLLAGQEYRNLPYASYLTPFAGMGDTSFPGNMNRRVTKNKYGKPLPPGFGTSTRPYGGSTPALTPEYAAGLFTRMLFGGSGLQDIPTQTRGTNYSRTKQIVVARRGHNKLVRERARARAKRAS